MSGKKQWTLIVVGRPGSRSRQWKFSWLLPIGLCAFLLTTAGLALYAGRTARALVGEQVAHRVIAIPTEVHAFSSRLERELWRGPFAREGVSTVGQFDAMALQNALVPWRVSRRAPRTLKLYDINSRARLQVSPFDRHGRAIPESFTALRDFMRCRRTGHKMDMSPKLIALLMRISDGLGDPVLQVISAHRKVDYVVTSPRSQHARGTAADIRVAGISPRTLQRTAFEEGATGIGIYPADRFVHVDVREVPYYWRENRAGENERVLRIK